MDFIKPKCPNCKKYFWNPIIQTENVKFETGERKHNDPNNFTNE